MAFQLHLNDWTYNTIHLKNHTAILCFVVFCCGLTSANNIYLCPLGFTGTGATIWYVWISHMRPQACYNILHNHDKHDKRKQSKLDILWKAYESVSIEESSINTKSLKINWQVSSKKYKTSSDVAIPLMSVKIVWIRWSILKWNLEEHQPYLQ